MCLEPTTMMMTAMALQGASAYMNNQAQKKVVDQRNVYMASEDERQRGYERESSDTLAGTMSRFARENQDQGISDAAMGRESNLGAVLDDGDDYAPVADDAPTVVRSTIAKRMADAIAQGRDQIKAQAKLGAYGANQFGNALDLSQSGERIGQLGNFSSGSSAVLPYEMNAALSAGGRYRNLADMFRIAGQGMSLYSMMGAPAAAGAGSVMRSPGGYSLNISP